ncbi:MAG TPA: EF-hand domain-containing protein [Rhodanobacteraceae bacterium]|nr:EF-hand domain-containing protein [Rhodanobacteraceae bacterium]
MQTRKLTIALGALIAGAAFGPAALAQSSSSQQYETRNATQTQNMDQQWQQMDANHDGHVSKSEFDNYWNQQFKTADTSNDGKLTKQQLRTADETMNGGATISKSSFNRMWRSADTNHDGSLSQNEFMAYHDKMFRKADTNNDGRLSKAEVRNAVQKHDESIASL